jgi:hypothetical protein
MKYALFAASLVLIAGSAVGCGGDDGGGSSAPGGASKDDFCSAFGELFTSMASIDPTNSSEAVTALKDGAKKLGDIGTPDGIPDDARNGFEVFTDAIAGLDDNADLASIDTIPGVSAAETADITTFFTWAATECPAALGGITDVPSPSAS